MNILEIGIARGEEIGKARGEKQGEKIGRLKELIDNIDSAMKNFNINLKQACEGLDSTVEEYEEAKKQIALWNKEHIE